MNLSDTDRRLIAALENGLPLATRPYVVLGRALGWDEDTVIERVRALVDSGVFRRFGLVVRHRELGYRANAMVVWDVADDKVGEAARRLSEFPFVTLCYRRPRCLPDWPYNLFCMIHGRDRGTVLELVAEVGDAAGLSGAPRAVLFSKRRFKQCGARYSGALSAPLLAGAPGGDRGRENARAVAESVVAESVVAEFAAGAPS
ncbi:MAG: AsnC family transcriptional regulator [Alphaproteobacteria bacterium]